MILPPLVFPAYGVWGTHIKAAKTMGLQSGAKLLFHSIYFIFLLRTLLFDFIKQPLNIIFSLESETFTLKQPIFNFGFQPYLLHFFQFFRCSELHNLNLKLYSNQHFKIDLLHWIMVPQINGGLQLNYATQSSQADSANDAQPSLGSLGQPRAAQGRLGQPRADMGS